MFFVQGAAMAAENGLRRGVLAIERRTKRSLAGVMSRGARHPLAHARFAGSGAGQNGMLYYNKYRACAMPTPVPHHHHHHHPGHGHPPAGISPSILRMSVVERLALAAVLIALLWGAVLWAMAGSRDQVSGIRGSENAVAFSSRSRSRMPET